ncbi:MAG: phosphopantetheine-binding protein [Gemmatimonadota bacterium]|nr:phosphopantetheine-binding protein [Gemmatimonadota bacterium]
MRQAVVEAKGAEGDHRLVAYVSFNPGRSLLAGEIRRRLAERGYEAPRPGFESVIADVWRDLLEVERVGRHDNFFELGGHSLLSIRATVEVEERSGRALDPRDFFFRSLAQLAATT